MVAIFKVTNLNRHKAAKKGPPLGVHHHIHLSRKLNPSAPTLLDGTQHETIHSSYLKLIADLIPILVG
jgi:hypothetical protein